MADKDEAEKTIAEDLVVTKYKMAGDIVNRKVFFINIYLITSVQFVLPHFTYTCHNWDAARGHMGLLVIHSFALHWVDS